VEIDSQLTFVSQTTKVVLKAKQGIGALTRQLRKWAPSKVFKCSIISIELPAFFYAIPIWFPPGKMCKLRLERVLKYAARLILNDFKQTTTYEDLIKKMNWKPLVRTVMEQRLMLMRKYLIGERILPDGVFQIEEPTHARQSQRLLGRRNRSSMLVKRFRDQRNKKEQKWLQNTCGAYGTRSTTML
jgi:hypothetical protein